MKVLLVNKFLHHVGGVETYLAWQTHALQAAGHDVALVGMQPPSSAVAMPLPDLPTWLTPTRDFDPGAAGRLHSALASVWSSATARVMTEALSAFNPDVVHMHGTCYQLTPSLVHAVAAARVPIVLTTHEYKLICANQTLYDDSTRSMCVACVGASGPAKVLAPIRRGCMKGSRAVSVLGALEGRVAERVWREADPIILAPSIFMRDLLLSDGWPVDRVRHLDLPWRPVTDAPTTASGRPRDSVVFLGRLAPVKGAEMLLTIWDDIAENHPGVRLRILGEGSERGRLQAQVARLGTPRVDFLGRCSPQEVRRQLDRALVTVHPAQWYENSPYSVRESLMAGVPAIVSDLGGTPELLGPESGWVVPHTDRSAWRSVLDISISTPKAGSAALRAEVASRATTAQNHLSGLVGIYNELLAKPAPA